MTGDRRKKHVDVDDPVGYGKRKQRRRIRRELQKLPDDVREVEPDSDNDGLKLRGQDEIYDELETRTRKEKT